MDKKDKEKTVEGGEGCCDVATTTTTSASATTSTPSSPVPSSSEEDEDIDFEEETGYMRVDAARAEEGQRLVM